MSRSAQPIDCPSVRPSRLLFLARDHPLGGNTLSLRNAVAFATIPFIPSGRTWPSLLFVAIKNLEI